MSVINYIINMHFWLILQNQPSESESSSGFLYLVKIPM